MSMNNTIVHQLDPKQLLGNKLRAARFVQRKRAFSSPPKMNSKLQQMMKKHKKKVETPDGCKIGEITNEYRKAEGQIFNLLLKNRKRQASVRRLSRYEWKKRSALMTRMKREHEIFKSTFLRKLNEKNSNFEKELGKFEYGPTLNEIYKIKMKDRFGSETRNVPIPESVEEFDYLVSDSTESSEEENAPIKSQHRIPSQPALNLPRIGDGGELPFSPLTKHYFPKRKKRNRKRSQNVFHKEFDVSGYLRKYVFEKPGNVEDVFAPKITKEEKLRRSKTTPHEDRLKDYSAQLYSLVNSPRGTVNKEIEDMRKERELKKALSQKRREERRRRRMNLKLEDNINLVVQKCKGCLKAYLFMSHLFQTYLETKREEREMEEFSKDRKSLEFARLFNSRFESHCATKLPAIRRLTKKNGGRRRTKSMSPLGKKRRKLNFREKYKNLLEQENVQEMI